MYGGSIIALITGVWALYKLFYANKVVGEVIEIKPFRKKSGLLLFGKLELKVEKLIKLGDDNWLYVPLIKEVVIKEKEYDYLLVAAKKPDDNINKKKAVVCHVKAGNSLDSSNNTIFIDWGLVKAV